MYSNLLSVHTIHYMDIQFKHILCKVDIILNWSITLQCFQQIAMYENQANMYRY